MNDEKMHTIELKNKKLAIEQEEFEKLKNKMKQNNDIQLNMKKQSELSIELQMAFKRGDTATVKRIERLLAPDENKTKIKHPWA